MRLDQFNGILVFLKVAETRSFTRAAAELGVTPSSVSEAVKRLEERLGVRLLNRTTRSVGLTEAGAMYAKRVRFAADEIRAAGSELMEAATVPSGTLRLSLPWIAAPLLFDSLFEPFLKAYPEVSLDLVFDDNLVDLAFKGFDAGVRIGDLIEKDMVAVRIGPPLRMALLASPDYVAQHGRPETIAELARHQCIGYRFTSTGLAAPWEFMLQGRSTTFTPGLRLSANALPLAVDAALAGLGIAYVIEDLATRHLKEGRLVKLLEEHCPTYEPLHIYFPGRRLMPAKLRALVDFARFVKRRSFPKKAASQTRATRT